MSDQIVQFLGQVVAYGGGGAAAAYLFFRYLGRSWIESKFSERLEQFKHQQDLEIARLKLEVDSTLNAIINIQEKELEILPIAWSKLDEAYRLVSALISPLQQYANLDEADPAELEEFLTNTELFETQKDKVRRSPDKGKTYQEAIFLHELHKVKSACSDLRDYAARNGILIPREVKEDFIQIVDELWSAITFNEIGTLEEDFKLRRQGWEKIKDEIDPLYTSIEAKIYERLHSHSQNE